MSTGNYNRRRLTAPVGGVVKGTPVLIGSLLVIPRSNAAATEQFTAAIGGEWTLTKTSAQAWTEGQLIYWNTSTSKADSDPSTGPEIGAASDVAANPSSTGKVILNEAAFDNLGLDTTELGLLNGATAGSITASKVVSRDAGKRIPLETAVPAAAGNAQGNATQLAAQVNYVTAADGTTGVILPVGVTGMVIDVVNTVSTATALLKVYPDTGGAINGGSANASFSVAPGRGARFTCTAALTWRVAPVEAVLGVAGVGGGYKVARGTVTLDGSNPTTAATGLATIVAACVSLKQTAAPGDDPSWLSHSYSGSDGNLDIYAWKNSGGTDPTLVASTNNTATVDYIAFGT